MPAASKYRTFCTKRNVQEGSTQQELLQYIQRTLSIEDNLRNAVKLPIHPNPHSHKITDCTQWMLAHGTFTLYSLPCSKNISV